MIDELGIGGIGAPLLARQELERDLEREHFGPVARAWTAPRTWVTSEVVTSTIMNTHVRDNLLALYALSRRFTVTDIQNTAAECSLYDGSTHGAATGWQIAAGALTSDRKLRATLSGDFLYNRVDGDTMTVRTYVGNVLLCADAGLVNNGVLNASREGWTVVVEVCNLGSASSQLARQRWETGGRGSGNFTGTTLGTTNTASSWYLDITAQWSVASPSNSWRIREAIIEQI